MSQKQVSHPKHARSKVLAPRDDKMPKNDRGWGGAGAVGWGVLGAFGSMEKDTGAQVVRRNQGSSNFKMIKDEKGLWVKVRVDAPAGGGRGRGGGIPAMREEAFVGLQEEEEGGGYYGEGHAEDEEDDECRGKGRRSRSLSRSKERSSSRRHRSRCRSRSKDRISSDRRRRHSRSRSRSHSRGRRRRDYSRSRSHSRGRGRDRDRDRDRDRRSHSRERRQERRRSNSSSRGRDRCRDRQRRSPSDSGGRRRGRRDEEGEEARAPAAKREGPAAAATASPSPPPPPPPNPDELSFTAAQLADRLVEVYNASSPRRYDLIAACFQPDVSLCVLKSGAAVIKGVERLRDSMPSDFSKREATCTRRLLILSDDPADPSFALDLYPAGHAPGMQAFGKGDAPLDTMLLFMAAPGAKNRIAQVWIAPDTKGLASAERASELDLLASKAFAQVAAVVKERVKGATSQHFHDYKNMETIG